LPCALLYFKRISAALIQEKFGRTAHGTKDESFEVATKMAANRPTPTFNCPVVTDATKAATGDLEEAAAAWFGHEVPFESIHFHRCSGGVNNACLIASYTPVGGTVVRLLLRIYNNGKNTPRVSYEHRVLKALEKKKDLLHFSVPTLVPTKTTGEDFLVLKSGNAACAFVIIEGGPASNDDAFEMGKATAVLVKAMDDVNLDQPCPNPLYRDLFAAHHASTRENTYAKLKEPETFKDCQEAIDYLTSEMEQAEKLIDRIKAMDPPLPTQQIHADAHGDQFLIKDGKVMGLLDFEFSAANEWRVAEICVGLTKFLAGKTDETIKKLVTEFTAGYGAGGGKLLAREMDLIPELVILRVLSNVVYFCGRSISGEDSIEALTGRAKTYAARCQWVYRNREWIVETMREKLLLSE
jgi:homoserine kinase type II